MVSHCSFLARARELIGTWLRIKAINNINTSKGKVQGELARLSAASVKIIVVKSATAVPNKMLVIIPI